MGKNKNPNNKYKAQPSFFQVQEQKLGIGFINKMTTDFVQKNALKVFKDIATGNINLEKDIEYFNKYDFVYNLLMAANNNANYNYYSYYGLVNSPAYQTDLGMQSIATQHYESYVLYQRIATHLNNILKGITMFNGVYTRFYLEQMMSELRSSRNVFSGYFITISQDKPRQIRSERRQLPNDQRYNNEDEGGFFSKSHKGNV